MARWVAPISPSPGSSSLRVDHGSLLSLARGVSTSLPVPLHVPSISYWHPDLMKHKGSAWSTGAIRKGAEIKLRCEQSLERGEGGQLVKGI